MAVTPNNIITLQTPKLDLCFISTINAASSSQNVSVGSANGSKITGVFASNNDSTAHLLSIGVSRAGGGLQIFAATTLPISAGFSNGVPAVNLFSPTIWPGLPVDSDGNPYLLLQSTGDILQVQYSLAFVAGGVINVGAVRGDF